MSRGTSSSGQSTPFSSPKEAPSIFAQNTTPKLSTMRNHIGASSMRSAGLNTLKGSVQSPTPPASQRPNTPADSSEQRDESSPDQPSDTANPAKETKEKKK